MDSAGCVCTYICNTKFKEVIELDRVGERQRSQSENWRYNTVFTYEIIKNNNKIILKNKN